MLWNADVYWLFAMVLAGLYLSQLQIVLFIRHIFLQNKKYMIYIIAMIGLFYLTERAEMLIFTGFVPCLLKDRGCLL